jgi:4-amino-4-deoxy-L-arabinose transferase-like glycosyltransferase
MWHILRKYAEETIAWRAIFILLSSAVIFVSSGIVIVDIMVMMAVAGSLLSYYAFSMESKKAIRKRWSLLVFLMLAIGFMTKGPVAIVLFAMPVLIWTAWFRRWKDLKDHAWFSGSVLFLTMVVPWFVLCEVRNPGFLRYFFVNENFLRFVIHEYGDKYGSGHAHLRGAAIWMMILAACPWSLYAFYKLIQHRKTISFHEMIIDEKSGFFLCAVLVNTLFWSLARQLLITYLFPMVPLFAVWLAMLVSQYPKLESQKEVVFKKAAFIVGGSIVILLAAITPYFSQHRSTRSVIDKASHLYPASSKLYFVRHVPYSAYFYGEHRIVPHPKETVETSIETGSLDENTVFVANIKYYDRLFENHRHLISCQERYGKYVLFRIIREIGQQPKANEEISEQNTSNQTIMALTGTILTENL